MLKRYSLLPFFLLLFTGIAFSQQYNFHNYSVKDGVAQSQVYSLLQDSRGYLWMGTWGGGLTRFDGTSFKTFSVKDGLGNNYVSCIREDARHNLWIGTNSGLYTYNGIRFQQVSGTAGLAVRDMSFDDKGRKWLATGIGIQLLDEKGLTNISAQLGLKPTVITAVYADNKQYVWLGSAEGLFRLSEKNGRFNLAPFSPAQNYRTNAITVIRPDKQGNLWIGTYSDGMYRYNGKRFDRIDLHLELYKQTVLDIYFDTQGAMWLATLDKGVAQYHAASQTFSWLGENEGLSNNHVRCIIQDQSGNYWFGTSGGGVCNYFGKQFTQYDKLSGLGGNFIYSIFRDSRQRLWIGTSDKGLTLWDSGKFTYYNGSSGFANVKVKSITEGPGQIMYFGTDGQGVFAYNGEAFKLVEGLGSKYVRAMVCDKDSNIWIATAGTGLYKLVTHEGKRRLVHFSASSGLLHSRLTSLHYDKLGRLWYGTESSGVGCLQDERVLPVTLNTQNGLLSNAVRCLMEDSSGYLWIGTAGSGISFTPLYQGSLHIKNYNHTNGLTSSNVYLLAYDHDDNLFVGTETGLDHLQLDRQRRITDIRHYSKGEGFTGIETCQNSVFRDADGTIWFGTINGLSRYNPANQVHNTHEPVTTISNVRLFYEPLGHTSYRRFAGDWNTVSAMVLPYKQNHLTFDFQGINFSNPDAVRYQWKLEGFDKDWSPVSQQRTVTYSNLGPGSYTFMVKACNEDEIWNQHPATVTFDIQPPIWLRWWFIFLAVLVIGGALFLVFKWRINRVKRKAQEAQRKLQLEKEVVELEQKALRLQMNPHFIFNALNSIQSQIGTDNEQTARYYLAKFSRLMRQILDNSRNITITLEEEINTLENYLLIEQFCNGNRFDYSITVDENLEKDFVKIPPMLLQPFVENAIKHGLKWMDGKKGIIAVAFEEHDGILECSVSDNGIGRAKSEELNRNSKEPYHKSTALLVTRERLDLYGEMPGLQSLEIIDLHDKNGEASGTKVIVRIPI